MTVVCSICKIKIKEGIGRWNLPTGIECMKCHEKPKKEPKFVNIGGYKIPYKKLMEYADVVEYTRRAALRGITQDEPTIILKALQNRVNIHKVICEIAGYDHDSTEPEAIKMREALEKWLEKNVMTKPQMKGLV